MRAFLSTRKQGVPCAVVIINDNSKDNTAKVAKYISEHFLNVVVLTNRYNLGVSGARNRGISITDTQYVAFLDADDVWLPQKLEKQKQLFEDTPDCTLVSCNCLQISPSGKVLKEGHKNRPPVSGIDAWKTLLEYNFIPTPTVFAPTDMIKAVGAFDEGLKVAEDLDLWIKLAKKGSVGIVDDVLVHYFDYEGSLMKTGDMNSADTVWNMVKGHVEAEKRLSLQEKRNIYSNRLFGLAKIHLIDDINLANELFEEAISYGYPRAEIKIIRFKLWIKEFLKKWFG